MTPEVYLGVAGAGKTTKLLSIVDEELARGTRPDRIAYVSFTKRARREAAERACEKFGLTPDDLPHFRTLHALAFRHLGLKRDDVVHGEVLREFGVFAGVDLTIGEREEGEFFGRTQADRVLHMIGLARARRVDLRDLYDDDDDDLPWHDVDRVNRFYAAFKAGRGALDFNDILDEFLAVGGGPNVEVLIVDESQDLSLAQWEMVDRLGNMARRVVIGGDDDQCIFSWGGADVASLVRRSSDAVVLGHSHRVPRAVRDLADDVIRGVALRHSKDWTARDADGEVTRATSMDDVDVETGDVLVLVRNSAFATNHVVPELRRRGVNYEWCEAPPVAPGTLAAIRVWEDLRQGRRVVADAAREVYALGTPGRHHTRDGARLLAGTTGDTLSLDELRVTYGLLTDAIWHEALDRIPPDEAAFVIAARRRGEKLLGQPRVRVSTIHGAKGAEAHHVVLWDQLAPRTWREMERDEDSERRVLYVGLTRAREKLTIVEGTDPKRSYPWL